MAAAIAALACLARAAETGDKVWFRLTAVVTLAEDYSRAIALGAVLHDFSFGAITCAIGRMSDQLRSVAIAFCAFHLSGPLCSIFG